jgi:LmbE family N-acetylglucosaminyl deacetylase
VVTEISGRGTAEDVWRGWLNAVPENASPARAGATAAPVLPEWDLADADVPMVVAPHPDDEVLGVGGLLATVGDCEVVAVTDGEASHPESTVYSPSQLATIRQAETITSLSRLGLSHATVHRLRHPDGDIDEEALAVELIRRLEPGRWCLATWRHDGHPDHEAVGRAAAHACARTGARLLEYPVWMWHWSTPGDPHVPWHRMRRITLRPPDVARKAAAITSFRSQVEPLGPAPGDAAILPPHVVDRFRRPYEVIFT